LLGKALAPPGDGGAGGLLMKIQNVVMACALAAVLGAPMAASADDTKVITVTGDIVRYEPNKMIVVRSEGREMTYNLGPTVTVPSDVAVGRHVTLYTSGMGDKAVVTRVSTEVNANGDVQRTVTTTKTDKDGDMKSTSTSTIIGSVREYVPGKSVTVTRDDGSSVTYVIGPKVQVPADIAVGRWVEIHPMMGAETPAVQTITVTKTKEHHGHTHTETKTTTTPSNP
jgi:hypothetical protein